MKLKILLLFFLGILMLVLISSSVVLAFEEIQITTNTSTDAFFPAIYKDIIVWMDARNGNYDIYVYNISTSTESRVTIDGSTEESPVIYENKIVWYNGDIHMCDLALNGFIGGCLATDQKMNVTLNPSQQFHPSIYKSKIVWGGEDDGDRDIYVCDLALNGFTGGCLATDQKTHINTPAQVTHPSIYEDRIVWADNRNDMGDIYGYNLSTSTENRITTNPSEQTYPMIYGDKVIWDDKRLAPSSIYMYNLSSLTEAMVVNNSASYSSPKIHGNRMVYYDTNYNIYLYDFSNATKTQITNSGVAFFPAIYGCRIVYLDERNGRTDVYMTTIASPNWMQDSNPCQLNDQQLITYTDTNSCGTTSGLPADNGTYVGCDYCTPNWQENSSICQINDTAVFTYVDLNNCYAQTNLSSDNNPPPEINPNVTCDYCEAWVNEYNTSCGIDDTFTTYYLDPNNCFAVTGLESDNVTLPLNITNSCDYCAPSWYEINTSCHPDNISIGWYNDTNGCYALTNLLSDNNPPANNTYPCFYSDVDGDGIGDDVDNLIGNSSSINSTEPINITINNSTNTSQIFEGVLEVEFKEAMKTVAKFNFNFSGSVLNLSGVGIEHQLAEAAKGYILVRGLELPGNATKTLYIDMIDYNVNTVCIKDLDIDDISNITDNCRGSGEYLIPCNGKPKYGYNCAQTYDETTGNEGYMITGLRHSGIREQCGDKDGDLYGDSCPRGPDCDDNDPSTHYVCNPLPPAPGVGYFADANGNFSIDFSDVLIARDMTMLKSTECGVTPNDCKSLDMNGDGIITITDVNMLLDISRNKNINITGKPANIIKDINNPVNASIGSSFNITVNVTSANGMPRQGIGVLFTIDSSSTAGATLYGRDPANGSKYITSNQVFELTNKMKDGGKATIQVNALTAGNLIIKTFVAGDIKKQVNNLTGENIVIGII